MKRMLNKYGGRNADIDKITLTSKALTTDVLAANILNSREGEARTGEFNNGQLQVLKLFNELLKDTNDVKSFIKATRFTAANSIGSTMGDMILLEQSVTDFVNRYKEDSEEKDQRLTFDLYDSQKMPVSLEANLNGEAQAPSNILDDNLGLLDLSNEEYLERMAYNPFAFEQCMMDMTRKAMYKILDRYFPYHTELYTTMRNDMKDLSIFQNLDADTINSLHREFIQYLLTTYGDGTSNPFNGEAASWVKDTNDHLLSNRDYYTKVYPMVLAALQKEGIGKQVPFFDTLTVVGEEKKDSNVNPYTILIQGMGGLQKISSNLITEMWAQATMVAPNAVFESSTIKINGTNKIPLRQLALDYYFYNFYKLGYNYHSTSGMSLAPSVLKMGLQLDENTSYIDFVNMLIDRKIGCDNMTNFYKQYILNHTDNRRFTTFLRGDTRTAIEKEAFDEAGKPKEFIVSSDSDAADYIIYKSANNVDYYAPCVAIEKGNMVYYYIADNGDAFNRAEAKNGSMRYIPTQIYGKKGVAVQYFRSSTMKEVAGQLPNFMLRSQVIEEASETEGAPDTTEIETPALERSKSTVESFTEAEWQEAFTRIKDVLNNPLIEDDINSVSALKNLFSDTNYVYHDEIVNAMNQIAKDMEKGKMPQTIDEEGKTIDVCK
jgi:hypothetical protein